MAIIEIELTTFSNSNILEAQKSFDPSATKIEKIFTTISEQISQVQASATGVASGVKKKISWIYEDFRIPGSTGITAPLDAFFYISDYIRASAFNDKEAQHDLLIRLSALPLGFTYSIIYILSLLSKIGAFFDITNGLKGAARLLGHCLNILGLIFTCFETIFESYSLYKDTKFLARLKPLHNDRETTREVLTALYQDYFQLSEEEVEILTHLCEKTVNDSEEEKCTDLGVRWLEMKKAALAHRVRPWAAERVQTELTLDLVKRLQDPKDEEAHQTADELLKVLKQQSWKKFIVHVLGLAALGIQGTSYTLFLLGVPFSIMLLGIFFLFYFSRYFLIRGCLDQQGWRISPTDCIPGIIKTVWAKISRSKEDTSKPPQGCPKEGVYREMSDPLEKDHRRKTTIDPLASQLFYPSPFVVDLNKLM
jgi:hypothetical protein